MQFDLFTVYSLAIGTLMVSAALTLWERGDQPRHARELGMLANGYVALAAGCALATVRNHPSGLFVAALSNLVFLAGYLLVLNGIAGLAGRDYRRGGIALLIILAAAWAIGGARWPDVMWRYVASVPIALICGAMTWEMLRNVAFAGLRARRAVIIVTALHAAYYAARAVLLPLIVSAAGDDTSQLFAELTMYEGVLFSVALPAALLALVREDAHRALLETARTDFLTGAATRRWFFEEGERLIRVHGLGRPAALLLFDLDHFKRINDEHGHATGDVALRLFATVAKRVLGPEALIARIGGEEFAALLPGFSGIAAQRIGGAVASEFADTVASVTRGIGVPATVSTGLAELGEDAIDLNGLLLAADRALYMAKALGRNRIEMARPSPALALH